MSESLSKYNSIRYNKRTNLPYTMASSALSPRFNITLDELKELANDFINPFLKENPEMTIYGYDFGTPDSNLPDDIVLFTLVPGASENYIKIGFKQSKIFRFTNAKNGIVNYEDRIIDFLHFRKVIILSDKNWYVVPSQQSRRNIFVPVDYKIVLEIIDQLKNSFDNIDNELGY